MKRRVISGLVIATVTVTSSFAQTGLVTGLGLSGDAASACVNMTGSNPPRYPGLPDKIACSAILTTSVTFRGAGNEVIPGGSSKLSGPEVQSFSDSVGNQYNQLSTTSKYSYCGGNSCYAEFATDGTDRSRWYEINTPNRLNAVNGNNVVGSLKAVNYVVDGKAIAAKFSDSRQYLEVAMNQIKEFEVEISDVSGVRSLNTSGKVSPFELNWKNPNITSTPHASIPIGVSFGERWDAAQGKWRYFLFVDGTAIQKKGLYIINYYVRDRDTIPVQYFSSVQGLVQWNNRRYLEGVVTLAFGIDQCAQSAATIPDYMPFYNAASAVLKIVRGETSSKNFKTLRDVKAIRLLREIGRAASGTSRELKKGLEAYRALAAVNIVSTGNEFILPRTAALDDIVSRVSSRAAKRNTENLLRIDTNMRAYLGKNKKKAKIVKRLRTLTRAAVSLGDPYVVSLRSSMDRRAAFQTAANQCELETKAGQ